MNNPFEAKFDSTCDSCGEKIYEGDKLYAVDGKFVCPECAEANGNVCECGNFKKEEFEQCYECFNEMIEDNNENYEQ